MERNMITVVAEKVQFSKQEGDTFFFKNHRGFASSIIGFTHQPDGSFLSKHVVGWGAEFGRVSLRILSKTFNPAKQSHVVVDAIAKVLSWKGEN